jgi:hypothetical protein
MGRPTIPWLPVFDQVNFQTLHSSSRQTDQFHVHNLKLTVIKRLFMEVVKNQAGEKMAGKFAKYIPLIGTIVSCTVSYGACIHFLRHEIDLLEKDAHTIKSLIRL